MVPTESTPISGRSSFASDCGVAAKRNADEGRPAEAGGDQDQRIGQVLQDDRCRRCAGSAGSVPRSPCAAGRGNPRAGPEPADRGPSRVEPVPHLRVAREPSMMVAVSPGSCGWRRRAAHRDDADQDRKPDPLQSIDQHAQALPTRIALRCFFPRPRSGRGEGDPIAQPWEGEGKDE